MTAASADLETESTGKNATSRIKSKVSHDLAGSLHQLIALNEPEKQA